MSKNCLVLCVGTPPSNWKWVREPQKKDSSRQWEQHVQKPGRENLQCSGKRKSMELAQQVGWETGAS